ncbi:MAG: N-acetylmuramoyl-L-alanine amidase [bacterium]|nr:N-acetylmuramoyl-L-alanine amidase [bacterium]
MIGPSLRRASLLFRLACLLIPFLLATRSAALAGDGLPADRELLVRLGDGREAILPTWRAGAARLFCLDDLLRLEGSLADLDGPRATLWARGHELRLVTGMRFARLDGRALPLAGPVRRSADGLLVDERVLTALLAVGLLRGSFDLAAGELELEVTAAALEREVVTGGELLRLRLPAIPVFESLSRPGRLELRLPALPELAALEDPARLKPASGALIRTLKATRTAEDWVLRLDLAPEAELLDVEEVESLGEIQILLRRRGATVLAPALEEPAAEAAAQALASLPVRGLREELRRVVIDAGHGGHDPGAVSRWGRSEKDMTLAIALELRDQLRRELPGLEVLLTRDKDEYLPLGERTRRANEARGQLFLSIHINAAKNRQARGHEVFLLRPGKNEHARQVALRENRVLEFDGGVEGRAPTDWILASMAQSAWAEESMGVAALISRRLAAVTEPRRRPIQQAGFQVLVGASMPSVLVECGFITNVDDHRLLDSAEGRRRIAGALAAALRDLHDLSLAGQP